MVKKLSLLFFICIASVCFSQEICTNGIDDDGDGLIDLNDEECKCSTTLPSSLIPNPSFEDRTCCPMENARLDCAVGWIQASNPTTDYVNTCGNYLGNTSIPAYAPLPFPDGEGAVGFRDGQAQVGSSYKEYVGACLTESMEVGVSYSLEFFVGFRNNVQGSMSLDIAIFGSEECNRLPFGNGSSSIGCPANTIYYDQIDIQAVSGSNEWVKTTFEFVPSKPYDVIIIGPACAANSNYIYSPYFYLDGLTLAETSEFGIPLEDVEGSICNDDLILSIEEEEGQSYQWYKDGVALIGEESAKLSLITAPNVAGDYLVVIIFPDGCISSKSYNVRVPPYFAEQEATICENDEHIIGTTSFSEEGTHEITIAAHDGCDSIVTLILNVDANTESYFEDYFCEGEVYTLLDISSDQAGNFQTTIQNSNGCDSTIILELNEIPKTDGIELPSEVQVALGDSISIIPEGYDPDLINFTWYDNDGNVISNSLTLSNLKPFNDSYVSIVATDKYGCAVEDEVFLQIDKSTITIHFPNVFSPDNNRINDFFSFFATPALQSVESFVIFDRWGNKVYEDLPGTNFHSHMGWDGTFNGKDAQQGVYVYMLNATFIDGSQKFFSGNITLLRL
jgi:gliding motility-associated-like protein